MNYSDNSGPAWVEMERSCSDSLSLPAVIGASIPLSKNLTISNPIVSNSVKIRVQLRKHFGLLRMSLLTPIASNTFFPPSVLDAVFHGIKD